MDSGILETSRDVIAKDACAEGEHELSWKPGAILTCDRCGLDSATITDTLGHSLA